MFAKRNIASTVAGLTILLLISVGCSSVSHSNDLINNNASGGAAEESQKPAAGVEVDSRLVAANTGFGFKLLAEAIKQGGGRNVLISPSSVALALAMTYNGASGETRRAMERSLALEGMSMEEVNRAYAALRGALESRDAKVRLEVANSLWAKKGAGFRQDFIERNRSFFGAEVTELDFNDPAAASAINQWVSGKTNGKIEKIIEEINREAVLYLINAIYFKGEWSKRFDKAQTKEDAFTLASGGQKRLPMMRQTGKYQYLEEKGFQAVSLPYGDGRVSMYVFLPAKDSSLAEFERGLAAKNWEEWMNDFAKTEGEIVLPRFKVEYEIELNDALKALGMGVAFDPNRADFSAMFQNATAAFISKVKHKTFAEVNEEGTEAAAVTSVEVMPTSIAQPRQPFRMVVDRPFFVAIRDNASGTILFMGSITDPQ
jgi:serine protease inhibitor